MNDIPCKVKYPDLKIDAHVDSAINALAVCTEHLDLPSAGEATDGVVIAMAGLDTAQTICHGLAAHSGWWLDTETGEDVRTWPKKFLNLWIASKLMLVVTEVAEAMEGHRKDLPDDKLPHRRMLEVEMADAVIRILDLSGGLGFDVAGAIIEKLAFNQQRPDHKLEHRKAEGGKSI